MLYIVGRGLNACICRAPYDNIFTEEGVSLRKRAEQLPNFDVDMAQDGQALAAVADQYALDTGFVLHLWVLAGATSTRGRAFAGHQHACPSCHGHHGWSDSCNSSLCFTFGQLFSKSTRWCRADGVLAELENSWAGGGCALCASPDFQRDGFGPNTVLICDQCEREFHVGCLQHAGMADLQALPEGACA